MTEPTDHLADGHRHTPEFTEKVRRNQQKLAAQRSKRCWKPSRGATDRIAKPTGPNAISHLSSPDCLPACADELRQADIGDIRTTDDGAAVIHVKGKGGKERSVPIEAELLAVIEAYLDSRTVRFPSAAKAGTAATGSGLSRWPARSPLFVGRDGERITRGTLQSRIKRAFKRAGPDAQPVSGALVHGLRHTYATELAGSDVSVYTLMKLLGHESMTTSQRYVVAAGTETRSAAARNPLYALVTNRDSNE